jgi:Holliday junction DNA helicase RuvA
MISFIKGKIKNIINDKYIIIESSNIGYRLELGEKNNKQKIGEIKEFYVYTHVRENEIRLFGFENINELVIFELLLEVSGVGPKSAINLVSTLGEKMIVNAVLQKKSIDLKISGIGIKTADKIVLELYDKLRKKGYKANKEFQLNERSNEKVQKKLNEAKEALISLGYKNKDIYLILDNAKKLKDIEEISIEELIKYLLSNKKK